MVQKMGGRRSRVERATLAGAHPVRWFCSAAIILLILAVTAYLGIRKPYTPQEQANWPELPRHLYELWKINIGEVPRDAVLLLTSVLLLYAFRRWRQAELVRRPGPIEVAEMINATGDATLNTAELATKFRTTLGRVDLNSPATVPGAARSVEFLELLRGAANEKSMLGTVAGLLGLTWVTHAYSVKAVLRRGEDPALPVGITVSVTTLPRGGTPPHTVWATDWATAVNQAALAVGAAILPLTRLCRQPPWSTWRGLTLPPALFAAYLEAKTLAAQRRYDEALGRFYEALELDPLNLYLRLEIGALQEQLQLFLDALETYDDIIALGTRADERSTHAWWDRFRYGFEFISLGPAEAKRQAEKRAWEPLGQGWRGFRGKQGVRPPARPWQPGDQHRALLIARYRYAMVLGFSEVAVAQWIRGPEEEQPTRRDPERERLRGRLLPRLNRYQFRPFPHGRSVRLGAGDVLAQVMPDAPYTIERIEQLERIEQKLRSVVTKARRLRDKRPFCEDHEHFIARFRAAQTFLEDDRPATSRTLDKVAKSLIAASAVCADKDWSEIRQAAEEVLPDLRPVPLPQLSTINILRAQELFQDASLVEIIQLQRDYRWFKGRRRYNHPITATAIRVSAVLARYRQQRIHALIWSELNSTKEIDPRELGPPILWPPTLGEVSAAVSRALGRNPWASHDWQDFYNAACVFAMLLLPGNNWAGLHLGHRLVQPASPSENTAPGVPEHHIAEHAVRALERAIDTSGSSFAAGQRNWLTFEDPDLVGFRARAEFSQFRGRNLTSGLAYVPIPKNVHVLQLSAYVTDILRALASTQLASVTGGSFAGWTTEQLAAWMARDRRCWQLFTELALNYRDWRSRLRSLQFITMLNAEHGRTIQPIPYPEFPDRRIGDIQDVSSPHDRRCLNLAGRYARQERSDQFSRLRNIVLHGEPKPITSGVHENAGHLVQEQLSATELSDLGQRNIIPAFTSRLAAWKRIQDCLDLIFFTDDKGQLKKRKEKAADLERQLAAAVSASSLDSDR